MCALQDALVSNNSVSFPDESFHTKCDESSWGASLFGAVYKLAIETVLALLTIARFVAKLIKYPLTT